MDVKDIVRAPIAILAQKTAELKNSESRDPLTLTLSLEGNHVVSITVAAECMPFISMEKTASFHESTVVASLGWAMDGHVILPESPKVDFRWWIINIKRYGSNLSWLRCYGNLLTSTDSMLLRRALDKSPNFKDLQLVFQVPGTDGQFRVMSCLLHLGSMVTRLELYGESVVMTAAQYLSWGQLTLPKLTQLVIDFEEETRYFHDLDWLINPASGEVEAVTDYSTELFPPPPSKDNLPSDPVFAERQSSLVHLSISRCLATLEQWSGLVKALDFTVLRSLAFTDTKTSLGFWGGLMDCLPENGKLQDGSDIPLRYLDVRGSVQSNVKQLYADGDGPLWQLQTRVPTAKLLI